MVERQSQARNECKRGHRGRGFESRYRSYSQSGLGAEELFPAKSAFCFFYFFSILLSFLSSFFLFPFFVSEQFSFSGYFVNCQLYSESSNVFCCSEVAGKDSFSLKQKWFCFTLTVLCIFFNLFSSFDFSYVLSISSQAMQVRRR